jgi:hypothetical protein
VEYQNGLDVLGHVVVVPNHDPSPNNLQTVDQVARILFKVAIRNPVKDKDRSRQEIVQIHIHVVI